MSKLPKITMSVRNVGIYKPTRNLPNINQPDVLNVENYLGSPFYSYMFVTSRKKAEALKDEEVQEMLSSEENINFYIQKMSYDLKLQKVSMGAILLKNTYVHFKQMRKFIWQHNNPEKVIVKNRDDFLPGFKNLLTRFILMNYCAMNQPGLSGAPWVPENHKSQAFDFVNSKYKKEFNNFDWRGQSCRLRHPNPLNGHPKVNFSVYTDDMSDGRVFFLDIAKTELKNAINRTNAEIFELLSHYLGSLSIQPSDEQLEKEGIEIEMETPSVFDIVEGKADAGYVEVTRKLTKEEKAARAKSILEQRESERVKIVDRPGELSKIEKSLAGDQTVVTDTPVEFLEQAEKIEQGTKKVHGNDILEALGGIDRNELMGQLGVELNPKNLDVDVIDDAVDKLSATLIKSGVYSSAEAAVDVARTIIAKGLQGKDLAKKRRGLIAFAKAKVSDKPDALKISGNSGYKKSGFGKLVNRLISLQSKKSRPVDLSSVYDMI